MADCGIDDLTQGREVERFLEEASGGRPVEAIDCVAGGVTAHEEDRDPGIEFFDAPVGCHAADPGHGEIEQHTSVGGSAPGKLFEGGFAAGGRINGITPESEGADKHAPDGIFIVDDEHSRACWPGFSGSHYA